MNDDNADKDSDHRWDSVQSKIWRLFLCCFFLRKSFTSKILEELEASFFNLTVNCYQLIALFGELNLHFEEKQLQQK